MQAGAAPPPHPELVTGPERPAAGRQAVQEAPSGTGRLCAAALRSPFLSLSLPT